ncbi:MAG: caspase family protein [Treponema sp.]|nr:caspase family protein [Treponema sp.]
MRRLLSVLLFSVLALSVFAQENATSRKRYALVIGNQNYKHAKLASKISEAEKISDALSEKEFEVTFKKDLNSDELKGTVASFVNKVNADSHSVVFVYLSGHAFTYQDKNYFLPIDNNKFNTEDEAKNYGIDIEGDLAGKIKTVGQIYVIDGSYEDPFKAKGSRAIGIKGGLASAKSARESTVGFLFSAHPETVIAKKNSAVFADVLADEISSSTKNLADFFDDVKTKVASKTSDEQKPYSSATSLNFAFNGEELIALKKASAIAAADKTSLQSIEMSRRFKEEQEARNAVLADATINASAAYAAVSAEIEEKRRLQREEDARRLAEENEMAQNRSAAATAQILALRQEFEASEAVLRDSMKKNASAEERVDYIESMKHNLYDIRDTAASQIEDFNIETDALTNQKVLEIENRPLKRVEMKEGVITEEARKRRDKEKADKVAEGEAKKSAYKVQKDAEVEVDNKKFLPQIKSAYSKLEGDTYILTSLEEALTVRVADYDGSIGKWKLHVSADLFGHIDVFEDDIYLGYTDVTRKKTPDVSKLSDYELEAYNEDVEIYDSLFRSGTPVFYVKLYYKIMKWGGASEYHFLPTKCEIIRLGKKNKVITKISQNSLTPTEFVQTPAVEIRTAKEIDDDRTRAEKTADKELKNSDSYKEGIAVQKATQKEKADFSSSPSYSYSDPTYSSGKEDSDYSSYRNDDDDDDTERRGRNTFYVSGELGFSDIFKKQDELLSAYKDYDKPYALDFQVHLTFNLSRFYYWGFSGGVQKWDYGKIYDNAKTYAEKYKSESAQQFCDDLDTKVYFGRFVNGIAIPLGNHVRLYGEAGIAFFKDVYNFIDYNQGSENYLTSYFTSDEDLEPGRDNVFAFCAGGGLDIIFTKHFMMTLGANYNWMHYIRTFKNGTLTVDDTGKIEMGSGFMEALKHPDFHLVEYSLGLGFTW